MATTGIDVGKYKAHSVTGATTSKASKLGLFTKQILEKANWAKANIFHKFYHREVASVNSGDFQNKI